MASKLNATITSFGSNYPDGSLVKIIYNNFLTYERTVLTPGPNLNLIVGANGTGKSTVICGICLAVGGSPKILGRSDQMMDYIKHGCESGSVEIHIEDSVKGVQRIKVQLTRPHSCEFFLNGQRTTQKNIREIVAAYNIQIANPCTFLAQDKVKSFSEQSPVELLKNTEEASSPELLEKHEKLIEDKKDEATLIDRAQETINRIQSIEGELESLKPRVENYRKKEHMRSRIMVLEKKEAILKYDEAFAMFGVAKKRVDEFKKKVEDVQQLLKEDEEELSVTQRERTKAEAECNKLKDQIQIIRDQCRNLNQHFYTDKTRDAQRKFDVVQNRYNKYETDIRDLEAEIAQLEEELNEADVQLRGYTEFRAMYEEKAKGYRKEEIECDKTDDGIQKDEVFIFEQRRANKNEFKQKSRLFDDRQRALQNMRARGAEEAWCFYQEHQKEFEYPVYLPIMHVTIPNSDNAKILEVIIPPRDLTMFICGSRKDEALLADNRSWKISTTVVHSRDVDPAKVNAKLPGFLRQYGFSKMAIEMISAPNIVKQYLCAVSNLHNVPVGNEKTEEIYKILEAKLYGTPYSTYITSINKTSIEGSRYDPKFRFGSFNAINEHAIYFTAHSQELPDLSYYEEQEQKLQLKEDNIRIRREDLRKQRDNITRNRQKLGDEAKEWRNRKEARDMINRNVMMKNTKMTSLLENDKPDLQAAKDALEEAKNQAVIECVNKFKENNTRLERLRSIATECILHSLAERHASAKIIQIEARLDENRKTRNTERLEYEAEVERLRKVRIDKDAAEVELLKRCGITTTNTEKMTKVEEKLLNGLIQLFNEEKIGDSREEIHKQKIEEHAKLQVAKADGEREDLENAERLEKEKTELLEKQHDQVTARENWEDKMRKAIAEWRKPVEALIVEINKNFSSFFKELGCLGEVHLEVPENELDIGKYGIMIMVRFRKTDQLERLDHQKQSGGERSVSTMLYLLSLQELCPVPFRCVDEINQGMDATNERKVFDIIANKLNGEGNLAKTQYFLLTPKLLHGLKFNEKVTVQIVHNGPTLPSDAYKWDSGTYMKRMVEKAARAQRERE